MISRLKSLELHGYKTFAIKTNFEFPGKITTIVGPNGSGKSNIADAIRWVLGEQSYRLLRGRKTEDMIFAGSEGRTRAGMASATITFNNEDGWLPIDFSEVSVTRRAYRDGQNDYLLNGQKIRLRDIQELFAQSGLAERTYTLIGQGLVDSALSIRPDERRKFFEEAAGIGLYRSRREDSLNRLEQTRHNLQRISDIISELEPRLKSLEKQSKKFLEYKTLQADLQALLKVWYGYYWNKTQKELAHAKQIYQEREFNLNKIKRNYEKIEKELGEVRSLISTKRTQLNEWHAESSSRHLELEKIIRDLAVLEERQRSITTQEYNQNYDIVRLDEEIKSKESDLQLLEVEFSTLNKQVDEAKANLEVAQKLLNERLAERRLLEDELQKQRSFLTSQESKSISLKAKLDELNARIESQKNSQKKLEQDREETQAKFLEKEKNYLFVQKALNEIEKLLNKKKEETNEFSRKIQEIDKELQQKRNLSNKIQADEIKLTAQYEAIKQAEETLADFNLGAKNIMNASRKGEFAGKYLPLSETLLVPKDLEVALDAALGEYLDSILLLDKADPSIVIQFLTKNDQGRAILFPVSWLKDEKPIKKIFLEGMIGYADELIKFDEAIKPVFQSLLGNTIIFDTADNAMKAREHLSPGSRIVTMKGEIFQGNGVIHAGKKTKSAKISQPRQKQELKEMIAESQKLISTFQSEILELENQHEVLKRDFEKLINEEAQLKTEFQQKQNLLNQNFLDFEKLKQRKQWLDNQFSVIDQQIFDSGSTRDKTRENLQEVNQQIEQNKKLVDETRKKLNELPIDEYQSSVGYWNTNLAVVERASKESQKRLQENKLNLDQNKQRVNTLQRRIEDHKNSLLEIEDQKAQNRAQEEELQKKLEEIREKTLPVDNELKIFEKSYEKLQEELTDAQQTVSTAERYVAQGQLDYSRNKDTLENLRRRIEEDFGLVSFEYSESISGPTPLPFDGLVEQLPIVSEIEPNLEENINRQRAQMRRIGPINPEAEEEYLSVKERFEFLSAQVEDLKKADQDLRQVISELDELMQQEFRKTFDAVAEEFKELFKRLFGGGSAKLYLTDEENFHNTGIEIEARLPGRREQGLSLLSGGERSLTAVALIFSLLRVSPTPFCVLDEVDAALDEANVGRFCDLLKELSETIQFIVITHNRNTVQAADIIYGVTMGRDSSSQVISLRLDEVSDELVK